MVIAWILIGSPGVYAQEIVTLSTRSGVTQDPQAGASLFPGATELIRLRQEKYQIQFHPNNFFVRSRGDFVKRPRSPLSSAALSVKAILA